MSTNGRRVGNEIEAHCAKCKMDRLHVIETLKSDGNIHRVICRTCESVHAFRLPKGDGTKKPSAARPKSPRRPRGSVLVTEEELARAKKYDTRGSFAVGDIIRHATFGPGKVVAVKSGGKIDVGFESGAKTLISGTR